MPPASTPPVVPPAQEYERRVDSPTGRVPRGQPLSQRLGVERQPASSAGATSEPEIFYENYLSYDIEDLREAHGVDENGVPLSNEPVIIQRETTRPVRRAKQNSRRATLNTENDIHQVRVLRVNKKRLQIAAPIHIDGYFPLYTKKEDAVKASPSPTEIREGEVTKGYHTHILQGKRYFMPNGLVMGITMFHGDYEPPLQDAGPYTVQGTATNDAPYKGEYGYYYPLWTSGALADQANANTQGGVHEHTFAEFPNVVFYMPNDQANHATAEPGPYRVYRRDKDQSETQYSTNPTNIPQLLSTPIRFQIVNLDPSIKKKDEFLGGGTAAASPTSTYSFTSISSKGSSVTVERSPARLSSSRSSLFSKNVSAVNRINPAAKVSKADITPTSKVASASAELNNAQRTQINGSTTTVVGPAGIVQDAQVITFMSGSNIRIDTSGEQRDVIRISVDDMFLSELQDVDINMQPTQGQIMAFDTALGATGITGAYRAVSFGSAFSGDTLQVAGLSASGAITGSSFVFPDGTIQTTASSLPVQGLPGVKYEYASAASLGAGYSGGIVFLDTDGDFSDSVDSGEVVVLYFDNEDRDGSDVSTYISDSVSGDYFHMVGVSSGARLILETAIDSTHVSSGDYRAVSGIARGGSGEFATGEDVYLSFHPATNRVYSINGATGHIADVAFTTNTVASFNGSTGAVTGVESVNGSTGAITNVALTTQTVSSFNGSTGAVVGVASGVATFTVSSKGAISTGAKTDSLHRLPYDATLTGIEVVTNNTAGFSAGVVVAGSVLGYPTIGAITGCTLGIAGATGTSSTIEAGLTSGSMTAGNFLYMQVFNNAAGATNAQVFAKYNRR